jgi:predicted lipid-binding transport protein (Tim44 family)
MNKLAHPINQAQMMVLEVVQNQYEPQDLEELRQLLLAFNHRKMQSHLDKTIAEKGYTNQTFEQILKSHDRK